MDNAKGIAQVLKEFKDYKIADPAIVISSENYKVVQIKKNIDDYILGDWLNKPIVIVQRNIAIPEQESGNDKKGNTNQSKDQNSNQESQLNDGKNQETPLSKDNINSVDIPEKGLMPPGMDLPKKP
jgi:hypothetical protein